MWHTLVRTDNLFGPRHALASVQQQISILDSLLKHARGVQRHEVLTLASKYAESAAWLYEDSANLGRAENWTRQALEWATEAGDQAMVSWAMFRRSQQATARRNGAQTISLAQVVQRNDAILAYPARAAARQQEAQGYALEGNESECQKRLDEAHEFAASPDTNRDGRTGHGDFCTPSYIEVQRANCWLLLGRPDLAIPILERAMTQVPNVYHRDHGQAQVRLSKAYAGVGQYDAAAAEAASAFRIAGGLGSTRMLIEAVSVARLISAECDSPAVRDLLSIVEAAKET
jgi:tetratricopeptide (TPR) repeat protein